MHLVFRHSIPVIYFSASTKVCSYPVTYSRSSSHLGVGKRPFQLAVDQCGRLLTKTIIWLSVKEVWVKSEFGW